MKLAIIGASFGQEKLCIKARDMGIETIGFAWSKGATCKDLFNKFYDISILDYEKIIDICKQEKVDGVVSNASDLTTEAASYIADALKLPCTPYSVIKKIFDKHSVRELTQNIENLHQIAYYEYNGQKPAFLPCIIKPISGNGKKGVSFVSTEEEFEKAIHYAQENSKGNQHILIEQFIEGSEYSVESLSFQGKHYVIQVTDKDCTGAPHFVEIGHHQPANINKDLRKKIDSIIPQILNAVGFTNGATHIEIKICNNDIYLIEINPRGGGDEISNSLVELSTNIDYVSKIIEIALGTFQEPIVCNTKYAGIYYLCQQTQSYLDFFKNLENKPWLIKKEISSYKLNQATGNYDRNGYFIYCADKKIILED